MPREIFLKYENNEWNEGIVLEEYNGVLSLVAATGGRNSEGTVYKKWGFPSRKDKKPTEKAIPWKIRLGNDREAVAILKYFLSRITS